MPRVAPTNTLGLARATGSGLDVRGVTKLAKQIKALDDVLASKEAYRVAGLAADTVRAKAKSNAESQRWPHELLANFFTNAKPQTGKARRVSALFGIAKRGRSKPYRPGYVEWWGGKDKGRLVGMSLATMFEFGTSKMGARPAFRPALQSERSKMLSTLKDGLNAILKQAATGVPNGD